MAAATSAGILGLVGCGSSPPGPEAVIGSYLRAWSARDWAAMTPLIADPPADFASVQKAALTDLGAIKEIYTAGPIARRGPTATVAVTSHLTLDSKLPLTLHSTLPLRMVKGHWMIRWSPRTISNSLNAGDHFALSVTWPTRAAVLGAGGVDLIPDATEVTVGLAGLRIKDPASLRSALVAAGLNAADVDRALAAAKANPNDFEPVQTLSEAAYQAIRAKIYPLPGTQFQTRRAPAPLTPTLGAQIVGQVGPITAEQLKSLGRPHAPGDQVGQGGIEEAYEHRLSGTPGITVSVKNAKGRTVGTVASRPAAPGRAVQTSIDPAVQSAAEAALSGVGKQAAIVVERASTGQVLASVSTPTQGFNLAFSAAVPPGSTFKVVTSSALVESGVTVSTPAACPPAIVVDGKSFHNDEGESASSLSFLEAFARSCNTAFIGLSEPLAAEKLTTDAAKFGIGVKPRMGLAGYGGKVPVPSSVVDLAATAIGQDQVTVSPLGMATVAATVDSGALREPRLVTGAPDDRLAPKRIDATVDATLHTLMSAVVTDPAGTAAGAGLPPGTFGKTGTAEFGAGPHPATHAWFIGFRGDLAFAVFVYGGGTGGTVAAPIAARLLNALGPAA
ncbi:MAG: hypothetical protein J2P58_11070 [Acidimicrobiaceae bacterium]|nr:hypothetical protein [Acidimicrobiaceae bacterium]